MCCRLYHSKYSWQGGEIGITCNSDWFEPRSQYREVDHDASERSIQFLLGWFMHPVFVNGDYPEVMKVIYLDERRCFLGG